MDTEIRIARAIDKHPANHIAVHESPLGPDQKRRPSARESADRGEPDVLAGGSAQQPIILRSLRVRQSTSTSAPVFSPAAVSLGVTRLASQSAIAAAISRLLFSSIRKWPLPRMPMSASRMKSTGTPACFRKAALQWAVGAPKEGLGGHLQRRDIPEIDQLVRRLLLPPAAGKLGRVELLLPQEAKIFNAVHRGS
jgi:hypothetical protein